MYAKVTGIRHLNNDGSSRYKTVTVEMKRGDKIVLEAEPNNKYDNNAVKVFAMINGSKKQIGYLTKDIAKIVSPKLLNGENISAVLISFGLYEKYMPYCDINILGI